MSVPVEQASATTEQGRISPDVLDKVRRLVANVQTVIFGKEEVIELCVVGLIARGHILIEDIPGVGKTTMSHGLAHSIDCSFSRIQFTSDMLPADILGVSILNPKTTEFEFREGPIFKNVVLADEINRTPPKTQSALLEAMAEWQVSIDGRTHSLPQPFMVMATQNPVEYEGTYLLPESQLDRFMLRVEMGYPAQEFELQIMQRRDPHNALRKLQPVLTAQDVLGIQEHVGNVIVDESVARYMLAIIQGTRENEHVQLGASPRASVSFYEACQARALVAGRDYVTPDDVRTMADPCLAHRIIVRARGANPAAAALERKRVVHEIIQTVAAPV